MKKIFLLLLIASAALVFGACSTTYVSTEPAPIPAPPTEPSSGQVPGMDAYMDALNDTSYKADKVPQAATGQKASVLTDTGYPVQKQ